MGTSLSGITTIAQTQQECDEKQVYKVSPRFVPKVLGNIAASQIAIAYGIRGPSLTVNTACSSGVDAIGMASMSAKDGGGRRGDCSGSGVGFVRHYGFWVSSSPAPFPCEMICRKLLAVLLI